MDLIDYTRCFIKLNNIAQDYDIKFDVIEVSQKYYQKHVQRFGSYRHLINDMDYGKLMHGRHLWVLNHTSKTLDYLIRCSERKKNEI